MNGTPGTEIQFDKSLKQKFDRLWHLVGNIPMMEIAYTYKGEPGIVYVKCENFNLTGSVKDFMALYILYEAYRQNKIEPSHTNVEVTSGNTGMSCSAIGKALGHEVLIIMPSWLSSERFDTIKSMGAKVHAVTHADGGLRGGLDLAEVLARYNDKYFLTRQFENIYNTAAHELTTGPEIWRQLKSFGKAPDAFVLGVGTGGTVMGTGKYLKTKNADVKIHPLESAESPTLSTGYKVGSHRIQGISDEFIPPIVDLSKLDDSVQANDGDAIISLHKNFPVISGWP